jgi:predicted ATP-grasp superfamily ATP-dependent carboligase
VKEPTAAAPPVLVTDARWRKSLAAVRALGRSGHAVIAADATRAAPAFFSRYTRERLRYPDLARDPSGCLDALVGAARRHPGLVLLPQEDPTVELMSRRRDSFPSGTAIPLPPHEAVATALDKAATARRARAVGIDVPETVEVDASRPGTIGNAAELGFPLVVKPRTAWGSQGVRVVRSRDELEPTVRALAAGFGSLIAQEWIPPGGEALGSSCLVNRSGVLRAGFVHRRLREFPVSGGPSTLRESVVRPDLLEASMRLLQALGWVGFAMLEWRTDPRDGRPHLLEINPRFVGSLALAIAAGVDFPSLLYDVAVSGDCAAVASYRAGVRCRWLVPGDLLHFVTNPQRMRLTPSFFSFRGKDLHYDDWASDDPLPSLVELGVVAAQALRPRMWRYVLHRGERLPL